MWPRLSQSPLRLHSAADWLEITEQPEQVHCSTPSAAMPGFLGWNQSGDSRAGAGLERRLCREAEVGSKAEMMQVEDHASGQQAVDAEPVPPPILQP